MRTPVHPARLVGLPVAELATSAAPDRWHAALRAKGTHCRDGSWVVSGPRAVPAALASPALCVAPSRQALGGAATELMARMARFSDGADHRRRRDLVIRLLPPVAEVARAAGSRANDYLCRRAAPFDVMPMARSLPAEVLARALGLPSGMADRAAELTGALCDALTPSLLPRQGTGPHADTAAQELAALVAGLGSQDEEHLAAVISILFQARDATAALIGTAVLAGPGTGNGSGLRLSPGQRVERVLRREAPVQCTRRTAVADALVGDAVIPAGAPVWIFVATAERGAAVPATFGTGPHGCPAAAHAVAMARQVVAVLDADCWYPVAGQRIEFEPRPNIRVPSHVMVARS
jgi:cytochrome P450